MDGAGYFGENEMTTPNTMETKIEEAIKLLSSKIATDVKSEDALRFTQAALNLANVLATLANNKR